MKIHLLLVGFGHVARRFVDLLDEARDTLAALSLEPVIVGIVTKHHGALVDRQGIDAVAAARRVAGGGLVGAAVTSASVADLTARWADSTDERVLVETTTLDVRSGEPAIGHVRAGFSAGFHVITANKGPVAFAYRALRDDAARAGLSFLFEGAVMDGIPIFNLVRETMPGVEIRAIRGVINSTTNHILTAMERGDAFESALARMQTEGVAEADASLDLDGWDAAAKTAALANVLLDADMTPLDVSRARVSAQEAARARAAVSRGRRLKVVCRAARHGGTVDAAVELQELEATDPLAVVDGQGNALELDTWPLGRIVITQRDGGLEKTAYALLSDLLTIARRSAGRAT